jgi:hypothetical protein
MNMMFVRVFSSRGGRGGQEGRTGVVKNKKAVSYSRTRYDVGSCCNTTTHDTIKLRRG